VHCPHAAEAATAPCNDEKLIEPDFDCDLYVSTCNNTAKYVPYKNCVSTVAANKGAAMTCRKYHLGLAMAGTQDKDVHCPHAAEAVSDNVCIKKLSAASSDNAASSSRIPTLLSAVTIAALISWNV